MTRQAGVAAAQRAPRSPQTPTVAHQTSAERCGPASGTLGLQRAVGNRATQALLSGGALLQRKCGDCAAGGPPCSHCQHENELQRHTADGVTPAATPVGIPAGVGEVLARPGRPLPSAARRDMEVQFGCAFDDVRVHIDGLAAESARAVSAQAYTVGRNIVFARGMFDPVGHRGRALLVHEVAHVVQQGRGRSSRRSPQLIDADPAAEREAERVEQAARTGLPSTFRQSETAQLNRAPSGRQSERRESDSRMELQRKPDQRKRAKSKKPTRRPGPKPKPTEEVVRGFTVTKQMCGCGSEIDSVVHRRELQIKAYQACDLPQINPTAEELYDCLFRELFGPFGPLLSRPAATTSPSGVVTPPKKPTTTCEAITGESIMVHERRHVGQMDELAASIGSAFFAEWNRLGPVRDRLDQLKRRFPTETARFRAELDKGAFRAAKEIEATREDLAFLHEVQAALGRICTVWDRARYASLAEPKEPGGPTIWQRARERRRRPSRRSRELRLPP